MNGLEFIIDLLWIISVDIIVGFILFIVYNLIEFKIKGTSTDFWSDEK